MFDEIHQAAEQAIHAHATVAFKKNPDLFRAAFEKRVAGLSLEAILALVSDYADGHGHAQAAALIRQAGAIHKLRHNVGYGPEQEEAEEILKGLDGFIAEFRGLIAGNAALGGAEAADEFEVAYHECLREDLWWTAQQWGAAA